MRLRIDTINSIEASSYGNAVSSLQKVLEHWLKKDYDDYKTNGIPCWRRVCVAVKEGGGDPALADEIAREHPLPATTGGATPHPLPATTGGATPHPLPATTGGTTPHPLPATTGGTTPHPLPATTGGATPHPIPATTGGATPHPLPATTGGATPHPLPATTGGATPHPLPATTGGATPHPLPATTGGATPHPLPATTGGATPYSVGGPTDIIHNEGMSPSGGNLANFGTITNACIYLLGGNSSHNESLPIVIRDISPIDDVKSPESGKSNKSTGKYSNNLFL